MDKTFARQRAIMNEVLGAFSSANKEGSDFVLKGGTALMLCYGLDRFSEDIDFDSVVGNPLDIIKSYCEERSFSYRIAKSTDTVKRYMIYYGELKPLKTEVSYRKRELTGVIQKSGITVYSIEQLAIQKAAAYAGRDRIRDAYDLSFIFTEHGDALSKQTKEYVAETVSYKGIEQIDYLIATQSDALINESRFVERYLLMFETLGLLASDKR